MSEPVIIKRARRVRCKHFNGIGNETCRAGVKYTDAVKEHEPIACVNEGSKTVHTVTRSLPCVPDRNLGGATCEKCDLPTAEEVAAEEAEMNARVENIEKAREAIVAHAGGKWKKGMPGVRSSIDCPVCEKVGALAYSRAGSNGHIHAVCRTPGCVHWME